MFIDEADQRTGDARTAFAAGQNAVGDGVQRDAIRRAGTGFEDWGSSRTTRSALRASRFRLGTR
jgi:hypothetical protein